MKKKSILVLLVAALTLGSSVPVTAAPCGGGRNGRCGQNYVDADGDGVCDNFVDADGDGINDNCPGYGNGQNLTNSQEQDKSKAVTAVSAKKNNVKKAGVTKNIIKKVQKRLNKIGYDCGKVNGIMNAKTKKALKNFKKDKGLKANSIVTARALKALKISN